MDWDPEVLFKEAWENAARRVNVGKHSKDFIRFFMADGTTKTFDIPPMRDDRMKDEFLEITLKAINNHPVEAVLLTYEAWFVRDDKATKDNINEYLKNNPLPRKNPNRREGVNFYYEAADGTMLTALAEIVTIKKKKRELTKSFPITAVEAETRMSHFFKKARESSHTYKSLLDKIISGKN